MYDDTDPLDTGRLAYRLKGAAHVLAQQRVSLNREPEAPDASDDEPYGTVSIYFPHSSLGTKLPASDHPNLTHFHRLKRILMARRRHAGTATRIDADRSLRKCRLYQEGIRDHTDIRAQADKRDLREVLSADPVGELHAAESRLLKTPPGIALEPLVQLPTPAAPNAVHDGEIPPLLRLQVILTVRVQREDDRVTGRPVSLDLSGDGGNDRGSFGGAEAAIDEIFLHINYDQQSAHGILPFRFGILSKTASWGSGTAANAGAP